MSRLNSLGGIIGFFIPPEVLSSVLLVFTMENVLDHAFSTFLPEAWHGPGWILVYILGVLAISGLNYATADAEELEELGEDLEDF